MKGRHRTAVPNVEKPHDHNRLTRSPAKTRDTYKHSHHRAVVLLGVVVIIIVMRIVRAVFVDGETRWKHKRGGHHAAPYGQQGQRSAGPVRESRQRRLVDGAPNGLGKYL